MRGLAATIVFAVTVAFAAEVEIDVGGEVASDVRTFLPDPLSMLGSGTASALRSLALAPSFHSSLHFRLPSMLAKGCLGWHVLLRRKLPPSPLHPRSRVTGSHWACDGPRVER